MAHDGGGRAGFGWRIEGEREGGREGIMNYWGVGREMDLLRELVVETRKQGQHGSLLT
jgi:hypothetical protein